jgi:hypothetical protein
MKNLIKTLSLICFIIVFAMICCTSAEEEPEKMNNLEGVWQLESGEWTRQDTIYTFPGGDFKGMKSYKYLGKINWANVGQDTTMDMHWARAGIYRVTEDTYVEYFEIHENVKLIGDSAVFNYTLDGDKWTLSSDWLKEEWKRIE